MIPSYCRMEEKYREGKQKAGEKMVVREYSLHYFG
jgi:hypothetical protein